MGRILVTGAAGFLGQHVVGQLRARGLPLRLVVRNEAGLERLNRLGPVPKGEESRVVDLTQRFAVPKLLEGCDRVIHVAGRVSSRRGHRKALYQDNVVALAHLLEAALAAKVKRFVYVSCVVGVGAARGELPATEEVTFDLGDLPVDYVQAKRVAELEALRACTRGLPVVFPTPTFCLGPGDVHRSSELILGPLLAGWPVSAEGGLNLVDVRDAAEGIVRALEVGRAGDRYLLGGTDVSCLELLHRWAALAGGRSMPLRVPGSLARAAGALVERVMPEAPMDRARAALLSRCWYYDSTNAGRQLGFQSRPLGETLRDARTWLEQTAAPPAASRPVVPD